MDIEPPQPLEEGRRGLKRARSSCVNYNGEGSQARVTVDNDYLDKLVCFVKKRRGRALVNEEKLDILLLQGYLRAEHKAKKKKNGPDRSVRAPAVSKTIAKMLRRKQELMA